MEEQTSRQQEEEKLVQQAYEHLEQTYLHSRHHGNVEPIRKAFNFAKQDHKGVGRLRGEDYINHTNAVA